MSKRTKNRLLAFAIGAALVTLSGCGNGLAKVTGKITVDGQPLTTTDTVRGSVLFFPEGGTGAPAVGVLSDEGAYEVRTGSLDGILPGPYVVTVSAAEVIAAKVEGAAPSGRPVIPRRYADPRQSGLRVEVGEGRNEFDFELDGTPDPPKTKRRRRR